MTAILRRWCLLASVLVGSTASAANVSVAGVWKLVSYVLVEPESGTITKPWGKEPSGYIMFLPDGHVSSVLTAEGRHLAQKPAHLYRSVVAYAGTYRVVGDTVHLEVEVCSDPALVGTTQLRHARIEGYTLTLRTPPLPSFRSGEGRGYVHVSAWRLVTRF